MRRAAAWAVCAAFATLVHYYAGVLALMQGLALLAMHRGRALRLWPAALAFTPAFAWIAWHAPRLAEFARPGVAWYTEIPVSELPLGLIVLAGSPLTLMSFAAALVAGSMPIPARPCAAPNTHNVDAPPRIALPWGPLLWTGGAALAAAGLCLAIGVVRPTFTYRYLTPFVPGASLLAAAWVIRIGRMPYVAVSVLLAGPLAAMALTLSAEPDPNKRLYSFEAASAWLAERGPSRLVFFKDHPATPVETRDQLDAVGGFFLRRAGLSVAVTPLAPSADDMNGPVLDAAGADAAVLWMYDRLIHHTAARSHPPRLSALDPGLECRDFGAFNIGVVACRR